MAFCTEEKLQRHIEFWSGEKMKQPLTIVRTGDVFPAKRYRANFPLLRKGEVVTPEKLKVEDYFEDYLIQLQEFEAVPQDGIYTAEPCNGFPWMEAIFGAEILGGGDAFVSKPCCREVFELDGICLNKSNPWYQKYLEFSEKLAKLSRGIFPVAQPILRGGSDTVGALVGQEEMACALLEDPDRIKRLFKTIAQAQRDLISDQRSLIPAFYGGYSIGFYHLWTPGSAIWYQEDLSALMAPSHYGEFLKDGAERICKGYDYTMVHLHPASFPQLDGILSVNGLKAVQINKDEASLTVRQMIPYCQKVLDSGRRLVLGMGFLDKDDIDAVFEELPDRGIALVLVASNQASARELIDYIRNRSNNR